MTPFAHLSSATLCKYVVSNLSPTINEGSKMFLELCMSLISLIAAISLISLLPSIEAPIAVKLLVLLGSVAFCIFTFCTLEDIKNNFVDRE